VLVVHGTVDERVAYSNALAIVARAQEVGVPVEFHPLDGVGHGVWGAYTEQIIGWMSDFLYRYVAPQSAVGGVAELLDFAAGGSGVGGGAYAVLGMVGGALAITVAGILAVKRRGVQQ
jgi:acetyl esterase/lipase